MDVLKNVSNAQLDAMSIERKALATNFADIVPDCTGAGQDIRTELINRFPLVTWLMNTSLTRQVRSNIATNGLCVVRKEEDGYHIEIPRSVWTEIPEASGEEECCWVPFDFAKCGSDVPLKLLCLKSCDDIMDDLVGQSIYMGRAGALAGISSSGDTIADVKRRVDRLSMAFLTAYTAMLGMDDTYTNLLKPFHGLLQVMENDAVAKVYGGSILAAFESVACRMSMMGGLNGYVIAVHPLIYQSLLSEVRVGYNGRLPEGWSRDGDVLRFQGATFIQDRLMPIDITAGTGEAWVLTGEAVGLYLATNLMPERDFIRDTHEANNVPADGCASSCRYYYNFGAAFNNNANKIMNIVDIPISGACTAAIGDLGGLVNPQTLIPAIEA